jgi:ubiquinone/menaquinone biosynthesis C-methylase UbiE
MRGAELRLSSTPTDPTRRRYELIAPFYDWSSAEGLFYAKARARAIDLLRLRPGATVLDVACGTGRNFELIERRIGPTGRLVGIDRSPRMLQRARARVARHGWDNVELVHMDAEQLSASVLGEHVVLPPGGQFDAVLCTLGLSVIPDWQGAWRAMLAMVRRDGRVALLDGGYPADPGFGGEAVVLRPFVRLIFRAYAADGTRQPWQLVERDTNEATSELFSFGYVAAAAGTRASGSAIAAP